MAKGNKKNKLKVILLSVGLLIVVLVGGFLAYSMQYYKADEEVFALITSSSNIEEQEGAMIIRSTTPSDTGLIFYPGAKVEYVAYIPLLQKLAQEGVTSVLLKMPFNMAIFDGDAADQAFALVPEVKNWYIGGHSMGGAMASSYASQNPEKVEGLILLGAYIYGDYPEDKALTLYGSFNDNLEKNIDYTENIVVIEGGNHAQFGNYGKQKGDPDATISSALQQEIAVEEIKTFIDR